MNDLFLAMFVYFGISSCIKVQIKMAQQALAAINKAKDISSEIVTYTRDSELRVERSLLLVWMRA